MSTRMLSAAAVAFVLGACTGLRWSGSPTMPPDGPGPRALEVSVTPSSRAPVVLPQAPAERRRAALFYSDLGPDEVDLAEYPAQQKYNYEIYRKTCTRCHGLARSISAPYVTRGWWEFYIMSMRTRASWHGAPLTKSEIKAVLDFLEYDSNVRKAGRAGEFEEIKTELKRRFESALDERMETLQKNPANLSR